MELREKMKSPNYKERAEVAKSPLATVDMLWELSKDPKWSVRKEVAGNQNTTLEIILELIAKDGNRLMDIPRIRNLGLEEIQIISKDERRLVKEFLAKHPRTSAIILEELAHHPDVFVRWAVAENVNTPSEVLAILAKDSSFDVRKAVAKHKNTSPKTLEGLAGDKVYYVVQEVFKNVNTAPETKTWIESRCIAYMTVGAW